MGLAVELLAQFEKELDAKIKDTGWKSGYGLEVGKPITIDLEDLIAEVETDGNEIIIKRVSGSPLEFDELCSFIVEHIG